MKWFLVFLMAQGAGEIHREYYRLNSPTFQGEAECVEFVSDPQSNAMLKDHIKTQYPITPVEGVWCIREDVWESFMIKDNGI